VYYTLHPKHVYSPLRYDDEEIGEGAEGVEVGVQRGALVVEARHRLGVLGEVALEPEGPHRAESVLAHVPQQDGVQLEAQLPQEGGEVRALQRRRGRLLRLQLGGHGCHKFRV